jgi:hypothetical protein
MADAVALGLVEKRLVTDQLTLTVDYDVESLSRPEIRSQYRGDITTDWYGRSVPTHAHGTHQLGRSTSSSRLIIDAIVGLFNGRSLKMPRFKKSEKSEAKQERVKPQDGVKRESGGVPEAELDEILKKIKAAGYDSLSEEERGKLFKASQRRTP